MGAKLLLNILKNDKFLHKTNVVSNTNSVLPSEEYAHRLNKKLPLIKQKFPDLYYRLVN